VYSVAKMAGAGLILCPHLGTWIQEIEVYLNAIAIEHFNFVDELMNELLQYLLILNVKMN